VVVVRRAAPTYPEQRVGVYASPWAEPLPDLRSVCGCDLFETLPSFSYLDCGHPSEIRVANKYKVKKLEAFLHLIGESHMPG
jgi:hypothetical protein